MMEDIILPRGGCAILFVVAGCGNLATEVQYGAAEAGSEQRRYAHNVTTSGVSVLIEGGCCG